MRAHATPTSTSIASRSSRAPTDDSHGERRPGRRSPALSGHSPDSSRRNREPAACAAAFDDQIRIRGSPPCPSCRRCHPGEPDPAKQARAAFPHSYITLNEIDVGEPTWFLDLDGVHFDEARSRRRPTGADRGARSDRPSAASRTPSRPTRGHFTTIRANFDLPAGVRAPQTYVHHSHIVEHEDNDMMRPFTVMA